MFNSFVLSGVAVSLVCAGLARANASEAVTIVATGVGESAEVAAVVPLAERRPALAKAWQMLGRMVQRNPDGGARALHRYNGVETWVEWQNLRILAINSAEVGEPDRLNGVSRRYHCLVTANSHRVWLNDRIAWSAWESGEYAPFPRMIEVTCVHGEWTARTVHHGEFIPPRGGGSTSAGRGITRLPATPTALTLR